MGGAQTGLQREERDCEISRSGSLGSLRVSAQECAFVPWPILWALA